ncbi:MAG: PC4/YdbC family ssDNA-binding protein [Candidatus Hadarchaeia archaeon]
MTEYEDLQVYGRVGISDRKMIVVKKTRADTYKYFDIREFIKSDDPDEYTGPTKKGVTINSENLDAIRKLRDALDNLIEVEEREKENE